jgi:hypothetical protein
MKEILQLFRRDAEHALPHPSAEQYDISKPRILLESSSAGSSRDVSVSRERKVTPPAGRSASTTVKEDSVFGRRW